MTDLATFSHELFRDRLDQMRQERDRANVRVAELMRELEMCQLRLHAALDEASYYRGKRLL